ncbi:hypothetical protein HDU76_007309 [Blyttiomyces sp. JEL0837]|nr:hypothetical protein HDU76_007309 [Blyttiomyces sp. JEL0837]
MTSSKYRSLWDKLPVKIKTIIVKKADIVTRFLNNDMPAAEIAGHGIKIWRLVFEWDLVDIDFGLLPSEHLPTMHNGLGLVKSKQMYQKLCLLRPDLIKADLLEAYLLSDRDQLKRFLSPSTVTAETVLTTLSSALINIVLRNEWIEELPSWWIQSYNTDNHNQMVRIFVLACCMGHVNVARTLYNEASSQGDNSSKSAIRKALEFAANFGNRDGVAYLLSLPQVDHIPCVNQPLRNALNNGHNDIVKMLLKSSHDRYPQSVVEGGFSDIFVKACQDGNSTAVETLLALPEYFPISTVK